MVSDPRPAPTDLEHLRRFVNTDDRYHGIDHLADHEHRARYFSSELPQYDVAGVSEPGWRRLTALRARVREILAGGDPAALTATAAGYPARLEFDLLRLIPVRADAEHQIAVDVLAALHQAVRDGRIERLRLCQRPDCGWCYYDGSKNRSARWCSADPCGDVMKTRAFRERQKSG